MMLSSKRRTTASQMQQEFRNFLQEQQKLHELHRAMREVELYESYIRMLEPFTSSQTCPSTGPQYSIVPHLSNQIADGKGPREAQAEQALASYQPNLWDRLFGRVRKKREALQRTLQTARAEEREAYREWQKQRELAARILAEDRSAYEEAVEKLQPFADLAELGSDFVFHMAVREDKKIAVVEFIVQSRKVIPREIKSLTKTGRLSISKMPVTRYHSLEQDYVCSTIFRIARDLFALLPLTEVLIHARDYQLNEAVGRTELATIVSVRIDRGVLNSLNLAKIDPSEAMVNFEHRMSFLKTKGFRPVEQLEP